jgi:fructuronate reductase
MLNGAHTAIAAIGQIAGFATVADVYADARVRAFIDRYWREVAPTLSPLVNGADYVAGLRNRFANPALHHRAVQIASDASQKVPQRIVAPLSELRGDNRAHGAVTMALALWIRSCAARNEAGAPIVIHDPAFNGWTAPDQEALPPEAVIEHFLRFDRVFNAQCRAELGLAADLTAAYRAIRTKGALNAIEMTG